MVKEVFVSALAAVAIATGAIVYRRVLQLLKAGVSEQLERAEREKNESLKVKCAFALELLDMLANLTVSRIESTKAAVVRKAVKAGEKSFTELTQLSEEAYQDIVKQLSPAVMQVLESCVGDTEALIRNKIEEVLPKVKKEYAETTAYTVAGSLEMITGDDQEDGEET